MRVLKSLLLAMGVVGLFVAASPAYAKGEKAKTKAGAGAGKKAKTGKKAKAGKKDKGKPKADAEGAEAKVKGKGKGKGKAKGKGADGDTPGKALGHAEDKPGLGLGRDKAALERRKHLVRVAKLERIASLAKEGSKADLEKRAAALLAKEKARYKELEARLEQAPTDAAEAAGDAP